MANFETKRCELCVYKYCLDCEQYNCENCKFLRKKQKISIDHQIDNASDHAVDCKSKCPEHQELFDLMCNTCNSPVCSRCVTQLSPQQAENVAQIRKKIEENLRMKQHELNHTMEIIEKGIDSFDEQIDSVIKSITEEGNKTKDMVDIWVEHMLRPLQNRCNIDKTELMKLLSDSKRLISKGHCLEKQRKQLDCTRHDGDLVEKLKTLDIEIERLNALELPEFPDLSVKTKEVTPKSISQCMSTFRFRIFAEKAENMLECFHRCENCGYDLIYDNIHRHWH
ncbi:E3 ubiquitin-protein ligase TRIM9-like [Mytilus trossulus]|uniref:E3 ubiquitin-protein ligase TRIM9-like n=1 Tax=Mytilus trossulus TaxID=6551 RepID=UPI0030051F85